jgi:hypothetical protein
MNTEITWEMSLMCHCNTKLLLFLRTTNISTNLIYLQRIVLSAALDPYVGSHVKPRAAAKKEQRNKNNIALMHPEQLLSARKRGSQQMKKSALRAPLRCTLHS